jgi:hypothetical protein
MSAALAGQAAIPIATAVARAAHALIPIPILHARYPSRCRAARMRLYGKTRCSNGANMAKERHSIADKSSQFFG